MMNPGRKSFYVCFDPRDPAQVRSDPATWKWSDNAILISATVLLTADGETYPIQWDKVAALADLCDDEAPPPLVTQDESNAMLHAALRGCARNRAAPK
jgi:hypothetical protein